MCNTLQDFDFSQKFYSKYESKEKFELKPCEKQGIRTLNKTHQNEPIGMNVFDTNITECDICKNKMKYINGYHQFPNRHAPNYNPVGWNENMNQFYCNTCKKYLLYITREYIFEYSLSFEFYVYPSQRSVEQANSFDQQKILDHPSVYLCDVRWDTNCIVCKKRTQLVKYNKLVYDIFLEYYCDHYCDSCLLVYHSAEYLVMK